MDKIKSTVQKGKQTKELKILLTFLKRTKEGKYATIEKSSIPYSRLNEQPEDIYEEQFNYGLS